MAMSGRPAHSEYMLRHDQDETIERAALDTLSRSPVTETVLYDSYPDWGPKPQRHHDR
jgi:hypothetical protein